MEGAHGGANDGALAALAEMGFSAAASCVALEACGGDVEAALERLLYRAGILLHSTQAGASPLITRAVRATPYTRPTTPVRQGKNGWWSHGHL
jgi:hypothetical protein